MPSSASISLRLLATAGLFAAPVWPTALAQQTPSEVTASGTSSSASTPDALDPLRAATTPDARLAAARSLLASDDSAVRAALASLLTATPPDDLRSALLEAITTASAAPPWLVTPLSQEARRGPAESRARAAAALGSIRTRDAFRALLTLAEEPETPSALRDAATASLTRQTGQPHAGDLRAWSLWFAQVQWLPEAEWRRVLADSLAVRADRAARERDRAASRLADELRRKYTSRLAEISTPANGAPPEPDAAVEARSSMLESFIRDDLAPVRRLGFSLALQELANAHALDPRVTRAALDSLRDPQPETRRAAASLLGALATPDCAPEIHAALDTESDPAAAAALLRISARWPDPVLRPAVLRWLQSANPDPDLRTAAIEAADALVTAGACPDEADRHQILEFVRSCEIQSLSSYGLRLLFSLGNENDQRAVLLLLNSDAPDRRRAVAVALADDPGALDALIAAAHADAALYPICAGALERHRRTADGFAALAALPAESPQERRRVLLGFASGLTPDHLLVVARSTADPAMRDALLSPLAAALPTDARAPGPTSDAAAAMLLLARTRLDLNQPAAALATLDALGPLAELLDAADLTSLRTTILLVLNRTNEAAALQAPPRAWIDGLERSRALPHARAVLALIDARFPADLPADLAERLRRVRESLAPLTPIDPAASPGD